MEIRSTNIVDDRLTLRTRRANYVLPDGTYRSAAGDSITVNDGVVVEATTTVEDAPDRDALQEILDGQADQIAELNTRLSGVYLEIQAKIAELNQVFQAVSAVMKQKHDTAKQTINNIR